MLRTHLRGNRAPDYPDVREEAAHLRMMARDAEAVAAVWFAVGELGRVDALLDSARRFRRRVRHLDRQCARAA